MSHIWVIAAFFKKWIIAHYSRTGWNFKIPKPWKDAKFYEEFIYEVKFILTRLSSLNLRLKIFDFWFLIHHYHVTLCRSTLIFSIFKGNLTCTFRWSPKKQFSEVLQNLGFISGQSHWWHHRRMDQNSWYLYILLFYYSFFGAEVE